MIRTLILSLFCLLLLALASVVSARAAEEGDKPPKAEKTEEPKKGEDGKPLFSTPGPRYVPLTPMILPILGDNGPEQLVTIIISLEVDSDDQAKEIKEKLPRLTDAYLQKLYGALDTHMLMQGSSLIDVTLIKQKLRAPTDNVLGQGFVKDILVQSVAQRRL